MSLPAENSAVQALKAAAKGSRGQVYVGADGSPVTFQVCQAMLVLSSATCECCWVPG